MLDRNFGAPARVIAIGAILTVAGLIAAATAPVAGTPGSEGAGTVQTGGGIAVLVGWAVLGWGIHRLGRSGRRARDGQG